MPGKKVIARKTVWACFQQFQHGRSEVFFSLVFGAVGSEELSEVIVTLHAEDLAVSPVEREPLVMEPV